MEIQDSILLYIFKLQGITNEHLRCLIYESTNENLNSHRANISRFVVKLRKEGYIYSDVCLPHGGKLHSLTQKGINIINESYQINPRRPDAGFDKILGDFKEGVLRPKKKDLDKHMIFVELAIILIKSGYYVRNKFYCVKHYQTFDNNEFIAKKIQPYGEFTRKIGNKPFVIEIFQSTDRTVLIEKFQGYRDYIKYRSDQGKPITFCGIYVITDIQQKIPYENDFGWQTVMNAAMAGLGPYALSIEIIGHNKPSFKELYNKGLLKNDVIHVDQNSVQSNSSQNTSRDSTKGVIYNEVKSLTKGEELPGRKIENPEKSEIVYISKYTPWIEEMRTRDVRLAKASVAKQQYELEESKSRKGFVNKMKKLFLFK